MPRNITVSFEDGTQHVYENAPDDITPEAVIARASKEFDGVPITNVDGGREPQPEELPSRTGADIAKDIGVTAGRSGISGLQQVEGLADLLPGVNATKYLSEHGVDLGKAKEYLQENASPQQQQAYKNLTEAKGAGNILSAAIENPSAVAELVGENIIPILTGGAEAKLLTKGVPALAKYAPSIGEGFSQMGLEAQKLTAESPDKELSGKGELAAIGSGALDAVIGRIAGKLVSKAGGTNVEDTLYGTIARNMGEEAARSPSVVKRLLVSTLGEGAEEALQGGQERIWDNYAKGATNLPTLLEGAVDDATLGSILGTVMGGGASALSGKGEQAPAPEQPAVEPTQPTQTYSDRDRKVDMENGLELAGVTPEDHPELYAELSDPKHYQSEESINALDERLKRYKSEEGEEGIDFASALPKEFDDTAWEAHLEKQREYARQTAAAAEQPQAENVEPEVVGDEAKGTITVNGQTASYTKTGDFEGTPLYTVEYPMPDNTVGKRTNVTMADITKMFKPEEQSEPMSSLATSDGLTEHNVESLQPHLTPEMRRLVESGKLTLHDSMDTLPGEGHPENVQGLTTPQGEVHLVANKLTPETLPKVAMHEMGVHVGMKGMVGDKVWGDLTSQALTTKGEAFDRARQSVPENTPEHLKGEETLAYLVENSPKLPIVKRAVSAIKNWARTTFGARLSITESDIHHLAAKALRRESKTSERSTREGTAYAQKPQDKEVGVKLGQKDLFDFVKEVANTPRENSRIGMPHEQILKRVPELTESAKKMMDMLYDNGMLVRGTKGNLVEGVSNKDVEDFARSNPEFRKLAEAHDALVEKYKPVEPYQSLPTPATEAEMQGALKDKQAVNINRPVPDGYKVKLRLDIPAYKRFGTWVVTAHEGNTKKNSIFGVDTTTPLAYYGHAVADNPKFSIEEANALKIADTTRDKYPLATVDGEYVNMSAQEAKRQADEAMTNPDWVQVGMDPERHSYFYDRKTMQPIKSGSRVIQIGSILMVKDPVYGKKSEYVYSVAPNSKLQEQVEKDRQGMRPAAVKKKKGLKERFSKSGENLQRAADVYETQFFSHDAGFINTVRRTLEGMKLDPNLIGKLLDRVSQAQTVSDSSISAEGALCGSLEYDTNTDFFVAVDKADNLVTMRQIIDDAGTEYGWSEEETHKFFTSYMVAGRLKEKYEKARALKVEANKQTTPAAKAELFKQSREITDTLKLGMTEEECDAAREAYESVDGFVKAEKMWHKVRENTIDVLVKSGLYSKEKADAYMDAAFYTPMYRVMTDKTTSDELEDTFDDMSSGKYKPNISSLIKGMKEQKFKGSNREVFNMMDNMEHWVQISFSRAVRAKKATDMIDTARRYLPEGAVSRVQGTKSNKDDTITCYFHGKKQYWRFDDPLMAVAFRGVPAAPFALKSIGKVSDIMRSGIVLTPTFTLSQLPQDIYDAAFSSGVKNPFKLFTTMLSEFKTTAFSKEDTEAHKALKAIGAVGAKDSLGDSRTLHLYDTVHHTRLSKDKTAWRKFKSSLEQFAMAGDNAIRQAVYVRTMKELKGDPRAKSIAYQRAFDIINFRRRGASAVLEQVRSVTPFMGAAIQAHRAAYQVIAGRGLAYQSSADSKSAHMRLATTSTTMALMAFVYNMLYGGLLGDDEDKDKFNKEDTRFKDTHIMLFGGSSMVSIPIRPSVFSLPYITGNHLFQLGIAESENPRQTADAYREAIISAFGIPMLPPVVREGFQQATNYDFFTNRPIVPERLRKNDPSYQYDDRTSALGKLVGEATSGLPKEAQLSPIKFDHFMKGWFSGVGTAILQTSNMVEVAASDNPSKEHTFREMVRMFPSVPGLVPEEFKEQSKSTYYDLREEVEGAHSTYNRLKKEGKLEDARKYKESNKSLLNESVHQKMNHLKTETDKIHATTRKILSNKNLSSEIKAERVRALEAKERRLLSHVQTLYDKVH
jgi:hypothetical protein